MEWVAAGELQPGDEIRTSTWETGMVESVTFVSAPQTMYNFTVDTAHTYFVGEGQWLVHNYYNWLGQGISPLIGDVLASSADDIHGQMSLP